jgi:hypothetical protein
MEPGYDTSPSPTKRVVNELHFNAIQNNYNSNPRQPTNVGATDDRKLLPAQATRKFVVVPTAASTSSNPNNHNGTLTVTNSTVPVNNSNNTNSLSSHQHEIHKRQYVRSGDSSTSSGPSSSVTSPLMSPTPSFNYHKPRHYNSMRSIRSGM